MATVATYQIGERVCLTGTMPVAPAGTVGTVQRVLHDDQGTVTALEILIDFGDGDIRGTTVFPGEVAHVVAPGDTLV